MTELPIASPRPRGKLLWGILAALAAAALALVVFILPAEYGIDPTGAGKALGVTKLSEGEGKNIYLERGMARTNVLYPLPTSAWPNEDTLRKVLAGKNVAVPDELKSDRFVFELLPFEGIELKYELAQGTPMIFAWQTGTPVNFDMHAHPFAGGDKLTESYAITDAASQTAAYVAPFTGIHGWYWQNQSIEPVTLTLRATGALLGSRIFDMAGEHQRELTGSTEGSAAGPAPPAPNDAETL